MINEDFLWGFGPWGGIKGGINRSETRTDEKSEPFRQFGRNLKIGVSMSGFWHGRSNMNTENMNVGTNVSKLSAVVRFFCIKSQKNRTKSTRQTMPAIEPWLNCAGQVELPSKKWLKSAEPNE